MKQILLIATGGTIASRRGDSGLKPALTSRELLSYVPDAAGFCRTDTLQLFNIDSTNMQPHHWLEIAEAIQKHYGQYDGFVVCHGTDTMAYTASMATFMLENINIPVVFTGSQLPLADFLSDGPENLRTAFAMAAAGKPGVFLGFDRKIMLGCRAVKVRAAGFSAFESINSRYVGNVTATGLALDRDALPKLTGPARFRPQASRQVFLLKLTPGLDPSIFDTLVDQGYRGIVIEAFGLGGMHFLQQYPGRGLAGAIERGVSVVVCSQCLYDSSNLNVYQVGKKLLDVGVIQGGDMTSEAALTKLMWAIGQGMSGEQIRALFRRSLAGEITL